MTRIIHRCDDSPARIGARLPPPLPPASARGYFAQDAADRCGKLFQRQRELLVLRCKGLTYEEAAIAMGISRHTVYESMQVIYKKLDVNCAVEAAVLAAKAGLV